MSETDTPKPNAFEPYTTLKLCADLANSERQTIWARNAAMLVGNSFIINAMKSGAAIPTGPLELPFSFAGLAICALWAIMTLRGWKGFYRHLKRAADIPIPNNGNPYDRYKELKLRDDTILKCTLGVIGLFAFMYLATTAHVICANAQSP
jgi:hypothetical protein